MDSALDRVRLLLEQLTSEELRQAWELLRNEDVRRRRVAALAFREGDRVRFETRDGRRITGTVERVNVRTVSICAGDGVHWRVAPQLLEVEPPGDPAPGARPPHGDRERRQHHG